MELFLLRHADAVAGGDDYARTLSDKGMKQAATMAALFHGLKADSPLRIVSSPSVRAMQTARILADALGGEATLAEDARLAPGMATDDADAAVMEYGRDAGRLCLVGHNPDLERLAAHLVGLRESRIEMKKGAAAAFMTARPGFGGSILRWLVVPGMMEPRQ